MLEMPEQTLINELNKILRARIRKSNGIQQEQIDVTNIIKTESQEAVVEAAPIGFYQEQELVKLLFTYGDREIDIINFDIHIQS